MLSYKEILALLDKAVQKTVKRVVSASDKQAKSVKKASANTAILVDKAAEETRVLIEKTITDMRTKPVHEQLAQNANTTTSSASSLPAQAPLAQVTQPEQAQNVPQIIPVTAQLESLFTLIGNKIKGHDQKQHLKSVLIKAILSKNTALFRELMLQLELYDLSTFEQYTKLLELHQKAPLAILHSPVLAYVQKELAGEDVKPLISLLLNVFQSIPESSKEKAGICLSMRDKKHLLPILLDQVDTQIKKAVLSQLTDLSFDAVLPSFRPSIGDTSYIPVRLTHKQYLQIVAKGVDQSIFIALTIGYLNSNGLASKDFLQELTANYLFVNYENCLAAIEKHFQEMELPQNAPTGYEQSVHSIGKFIMEFDHRKNDTRRFFETRLAQYINGLTHSEDTLHSIDEPYEDLFDDNQLRLKTLDAANKILYFFLGPEGIVNSPLEMERKISIFANGYKDKDKYNQEELERFMKSCSAYHGRDRMAKAKETGILERKYETSADKVGADTWNSSGGTMRSTSPTFVDAQRDPMRNMLVDTSEVSPKKGVDHPQWFWSNNRARSAYVGSISGHTCNIAFMLNCYMKENQKDPNLSRDINLFLVQLIAVYAKRGYHGMLEVIDVLHDPLVQNLFQDNNVTLNLAQYFRHNQEVGAFLEYAMNDTSVYAQIIASKQHLKCELARFFIPSVTLGVGSSANVEAESYMPSGN